MRNTVHEFVHTGQERGAGRRTGGTHVEIIQTHGFVMQAVEMGRF